MEWATLPPDRHASWALRLISTCASSQRHISNLDPENGGAVPVGVLPGWKRKRKPYLYSDAQIDALLAAALALPPECGLRRWTYHTIVRTSIVVTGMRLSEAMAIERDDVDLDMGVLTGPLLTKFGKSRLVPAASRRPVPRWSSYANRRNAHPRAALRFDVLRRRAGWPPAAPACPSRLLAPVSRDRAAAVRRS